MCVCAHIIVFSVPPSLGGVPHVYTPAWTLDFLLPSQMLSTILSPLSMYLEADTLLC